MAQSRKVLVAFDPKKPRKSSSDFLVPVEAEHAGIEFFGTRSRETVRYGMVVLTSRAITEHDLFARLVDSGHRVPNVANTLELLADFLDAMKSVKIGNVVEVSGERDTTGWLRVVSKTPSGFGK